MASRLEIELTSRRDDGVWTWRAAGARQPKGELDGAILPEGASVGDVLRAEAEFLIDGIEVTSVQAPKGQRAEPQRIELLGSGREQPLVTTQLVGRSDRSRKRRDRGPRGDGERRDRPDGERRGRPPGERRDRQDGERRQRPPREPLPERPRPKRIRAGRAHRDALLASLGEAERPVAEQLLRGGLPAVRTAVEEENTRARAEGRPEMPAQQVLTIAERLLPRTRDAEWRDRAEAALRIVDEVDLRDLRSVVVAGESSARDDETRALLAELRTGLDRRLVADERQWVADIATEVGAGRFVRALRLSSRSPKAGMAVPAELADRLVQSVDDGLGERTSQELWVAALDALASSPVRARVRITSRPAEPGEELLEAVRRVADILPGVAALFGIDPSEAAAARKRRPRHARPERQRTAATPRPPARDGNRSGGRAAPSGSGAQPDRSSATPPEAAPAEPSAIDESPAEQPE